jgi:hypothetical protein
MKEEFGVMVMKDGLGWGETYSDGHTTLYGWMVPEDAPIHDPMYCKKTTDVTYEGSHHIEELKTAQLVSVKRLTVVSRLVEEVS